MWLYGCLTVVTCSDNIQEGKLYFFHFRLRVQLFHCIHLLYRRDKRRAHPFEAMRMTGDIFHFYFNNCKNICQGKRIMGVIQWLTLAMTEEDWGLRQG